MNIFKEKIILELDKELGAIDGGDNLLYYLENGTDFETAPGSTIFHSNGEGGLAKHSWNVYELLKEKVERFELKTPSRSVAICGLLHDACKLNTYVKGKKWSKDTGTWQQIDCWEVKDEFPFGHGEKSVAVLQRFIKLTDEEMLAIRWHLGPFLPGTHFPYPDGMAYKKAKELYPLVTLLYAADLESSELLEKK